MNVTVDASKLILMNDSCFGGNIPEVRLSPSTAIHIKGGKSPKAKKARSRRSRRKSPSNKVSMNARKIRRLRSRVYKTR